MKGGSCGLHRPGITCCCCRRRRRRRRRRRCCCCCCCKFIKSAVDAVLFANLAFDDALALAENRMRRHAYRQAFVEAALLALRSRLTVHRARVTPLARVRNVLLDRSPEKSLHRR